MSKKYPHIIIARTKLKRVLQHTGPPSGSASVIEIVLMTGFMQCLVTYLDRVTIVFLY